MRVPVTWLRDYTDVPADPAEIEAALVRVGLEVEEIIDLRTTVEGPLVVGRVVEITELTQYKKPIRHCLVDVGAGEPRSIVCGATNFSVGDRVPVILPGGVLPGGFTITSRQTYGHLSDGMICSARELGLGEDHSGIMVLANSGPGQPGDDARLAVGLDDIVVELNVTPDRGYCLSVRGVARELSHSLGTKFRDPGVLRKVAGPTPEPPYPLTVADTEGCDRFVARLVTGVDPTGPSPDWLTRRLALSGVRPISLAVDITNYITLELGQPMHAFDAAKLRGPVVVRRARPGEKLTTLDGTQRALHPEDMIIADDSGVISLAAIMGGETTEVSPSTTDVLFEAAHWDPMTIARSSRRHRLSSEASRRFERGVDPAVGPVAVELAVQMLTRYGGGKADDRVLDINAVAPREPIVVDADYPSRVAGVSYPTKRVTALLKQVGATVASGGPGRLVVTPPTWRPDLTDPADLAEEVIRLDGYDQVPSELPLAPAGRGLTDAQRRRRSVGRALAEAGYVEVLSYPFVAPESSDALGLPADDPRREALRLANPLSASEPLMRTTLLTPLLATLRRNVGRGDRDLALYEMGLVFEPVSTSASPSAASSGPALGVDRRPTDEEFAAADAALPHQPWHVAAVLAGEIEPTGWWGPGRAATWADAIEAARIVCAVSGVTPSIRAASSAPWHPGRCAEIVVDGRVVGHAGELHPAVSEALDLPRRTAAMELTLDAIPLPGVRPAPRISTFPPALIDVALVVDASVPAAEVETALVDGAGELLESVRLFDVYAGEQVGAGRKSLAYKLTFRADDRTLTAEEAVAARDLAVSQAATRVGATLRGA
jgi:phenylalanyl-tRNA synthetase beta chain